MKQCCTCREVKSLEEFNRLTRSPDGRQPSCRECNRAYHQANKERHNAQIHARNRRVHAERADLLLAYFREHPCVDCGETDPMVLEFDHLRDKEANIAVLMRWRSWPAILEEIAKCEVVCANCHRRRTHRRQGNVRSGWELDDGEAS
jgi:hypothetical protein